MAVRVVVAEPDRRARSALVALLAMEEGVVVAGAKLPSPRPSRTSRPSPPIALLPVK